MKKEEKTLLRRHVRSPAVIRAFSRRIRQAMADTGVKRTDLAEKLGGFGLQIISRLRNAEVKTLPVDLFVRLAVWADSEGISTRWLIMGLGPMRKGETPEAADPAEMLNWFVPVRLILSLAQKLGVSLEDEVASLYLSHNVPDLGVVSMPLKESLGGTRGKGKKTTKAVAPAPPPPGRGEEKAERPYAVTRLLAPGYATVDVEQLPKDWQKGFVPIVGRLAAGEGVDTDEAEAHPPGWVDSYLIYEDAPAGAIAVRVTGDSMTPGFADGDMIVLDPGEKAEGGICGVIYEGTAGERYARLKRLRRKRGKVVLESTNPAYEPTEIPVKRLIAAYAIHDHLPKIIACETGENRA